MADLSYIVTMLRPHRKRVVYALLAMIGIMLLDLASPLVVAVVIDRIVGENRYDLIVPLMLVFLVLPFLAAACRFISNYSVSHLSQRLVLDIRLRLYRAVHGLACRYMQNTTRALS